MGGSARNREDIESSRQKAVGRKLEARKNVCCLLTAFCLLVLLLPHQVGCIELLVDAVVVHYLLHVRLGFVKTNF